MMNRMAWVAAVCCGLLFAEALADEKPVATTHPAAEKAGAERRPSSSPGLKNAIPIWGPSLSGKTIDFPGGYHGKLVMVTFWATWCPVCKRELPNWREAWAKYHEHGLEIIGVATDANRHRGPEIVEPFLRANGIAWEVIYDGAPELAIKYGADSLPISFLVDGDTGVVLAQGGRLRSTNLMKTLDKYLGQKQGRATSRPAQR